MSTENKVGRADGTIDRLPAVRAVPGAPSVPRPGHHYIHVARLELAVPHRKPGIREAYQRAGSLIQINGDPFIEVPDAIYAQIRKDYAKTVRMVVGTPGPGVRSSPRLGLGTLISKVATPIARALKLNCVDKATGDLKPQSPCARRRDALNTIRLPNLK